MCGNFQSSNSNFQPNLPFSCEPLAGAGPTFPAISQLQTDAGTAGHPGSAKSRAIVAPGWAIGQIL